MVRMGDLTASGTSIWATRRLPRTTWKWWGLMVRDGACAPPHHEDRTVRRVSRPHPEEARSGVSGRCVASPREGWATQRTTTQLRILAARCVRVFRSNHPHRKQRAQGRPGAVRTHGPRATKKHAAEPQVRAEQPAFPAQWFYGLYVISPVTGLCCHRRLASSAKLSASLGAPGPHDFAVRNMLLVSQHVASIASRFQRP